MWAHTTLHSCDLGAVPLLQSYCPAACAAACTMSSAHLVGTAMPNVTPAAIEYLHASLCRQVKAVALLGALAVRGFHQSKADWCPRPHLAVLGERIIDWITNQT